MGDPEPPFREERTWARRRSRRGGRVTTWLRRLAVAVAAAVGLAGAALAGLWLTLPDPAPLAGSWPDATAYMELRRAQARARGRELRVRWEPVPLERIPGHVQRAVRVAEDAMFFRHGGVDWYEVRASLREWWSEDDELRGASTLTMQLARNLYLSPERSLFRKAREVLLALRLEDRLSKERILELYLNVVELGPGVFGVEAASRHYWGMSVSALDPRRAVELAATLPSPLEDNPSTRTRRFRWRTDLIRRRAFGADAAGADTLRGLPGISPGGDSLLDAPRRELPAPDTTSLPAPDTSPAGGSP